MACRIDIVDLFLDYIKCKASSLKFDQALPRAPTARIIVHVRTMRALPSCSVPAATPDPQPRAGSPQPQSHRATQTSHPSLSLSVSLSDFALLPPLHSSTYMYVLHTANKLLHYCAQVGTSYIYSCSTSRYLNVQRINAVGTLLAEHLAGLYRCMAGSFAPPSVSV